MTAHSIKVLTCDRCRTVEEIRRAEQEYAWAGINYSEVNGPRWIGTQRSAKPVWADLCPQCSRELHDWFKHPEAV